MTNKARVRRVEQAARRRITAFWASFNDAELKAIAENDPVAIARAKAQGAEEIMALQMALMTPEEREELNRIAEEIKLSDYEHKSLGR